MTPEMNAMIQISNFKQQLVILDKTSPLYKKSSAVILLGHNNSPYNLTINKHMNNLSFPIRLKKINNQYKAGPLIGILTVRGKNGFRGNKSNYIDIISAGIKKGVLIYVFPAESLDIDQKLVEGYFYSPSSKKWFMKKMPLPDVVYNRLPSRKLEKNIYVKKVIRYLEKQKIPHFNPCFFDKLTLNSWMKRSKKFNILLPETLPFNKKNFLKLLEKYPMLYLKPVHGKAGIDFLKIEKDLNSYTLLYQNKNVLSKMNFTDIYKLWNKITRFTNTKKYIIQQGIYLKTYKNDPYDIRILVQKNRKTNWIVSGIGCRIAGHDSITTHVPRGGYILPFNKVLSNSFEESFSLWEKKLNEIAVDLTKHIENCSGYSLGEMSLDLGIDENNNLWFFEANSKPMKFDEPYIRHTSLIRLLQYFSDLSGFDYRRIK